MNCPRCSEPLDEEFYGPCKTCREALREKSVNYAGLRQVLFLTSAVGFPSPQDR